MMHLEFAKQNSRLLYLLLLLCAAMACTKVQTVEDLQAYVKDPDNGLRKEREIGRVKMSVTYRPTDLLVKQSLSSKPTDGEIDSLRRDFGKMVYFVLSMSAEKREVEGYALPKNGFSDRFHTLAFEMGNYVRLITEAKDTIPVADYFYQRTFGAGESSDLLFLFDQAKLQKSSSFKIQVDDFGLGVGDQNFKFQTDNIKDTPSLGREYLKQ